MSIELKHINAENYTDVFDITITPEQEKFVTSPVKSLATAYVYYDRSIPLGIFCNDALIGYVLVFYDRDAHEYNICHMSIDVKYQGKGFGKAALSKIITFIFSKPLGEASRIVVSCAENNKPIIHLNEHFGFQSIGHSDEAHVEMSLNIPTILSDEELKAVTGGTSDLSQQFDDLATVSTSHASHDSAKIKTGDTRSFLTEDQLTPEYIHRQIFGAKYDEISGN